LLASAVAAPIPVPATDGKYHLAYELVLTDALSQDVTMTSLAVVAGDKTLLTLSGDKLVYRSASWVAPPPPARHWGRDKARSSGSTWPWSDPPTARHPRFPQTSRTRSVSRCRSRIRQYSYRR